MIHNVICPFNHHLVWGVNSGTQGISLRPLREPPRDAKKSRGVYATVDRFNPEIWVRVRIHLGVRPATELAAPDNRNRDHVHQTT